MKKQYIIPSLKEKSVLADVMLLAEDNGPSNVVDLPDNWGDLQPDGDW